MNEFPFITCLCPTFRRPKLLENAIACFLSQDYPADRRRLLILDDAGQHKPQYGEPFGTATWILLAARDRYPSLPAKYNALASMADVRTEIIAIWEDDDVYLPWHLSTHAAALYPPDPRPGDGAAWSKPSRILSTYTGKPEQEPAAGRFFASIAVRKSLWDQVRGLPPTKAANFDQQFLTALTAAAGPPADPLRTSPQRVPGFCFRWGIPGAHNCQGYMGGGPTDETWYDRRAAHGDGTPAPPLRPNLDRETQAIYAQFSPQPAAPHQPDAPARDAACAA